MFNLHIITTGIYVKEMKFFLFFGCLTCKIENAACVAPVEQQRNVIAVDDDSLALVVSPDRCNRAPKSIRKHHVSSERT